MKCCNVEDAISNIKRHYISKIACQLGVEIHQLLHDLLQQWNQYVHCNEREM